MGTEKQNEISLENIQFSEWSILKAYISFRRPKEQGNLKSSKDKCSVETKHSQNLQNDTKYCSLELDDVQWDGLTLASLG